MSVESEILKRYERIMKEIPRQTSLIAVSKAQPVQKIKLLYQAGHRDFGENYVQECISKTEELAKEGITDLRWHFLGHLQTNKVKQILPRIGVLHSLDSVKLAREIQKRLVGSETLSAFVEVNIDGEESKSGIHPQQVLELIDDLRSIETLKIEGLMCVPKYSEDPEQSRSAFKRLRALRDALGGQTRGKLSMGMTHDFRIAIEEGATHIRVGTGIFGERG